MNANGYKSGAIIQCRMASTRLPQKCLLHFPDNKTVIEQVISNATQTGVDEIIVALPEEDQGSELERIIVAKAGVKVFFGSQNNVMSRFVNCAKEHSLDYVLRVTADDPFRISQVEQSVLSLLISSGLKYVRTTGLPMGQNAEAYRAKDLEELLPLAESLNETEHVTTLFQRYPHRLDTAEIDYEVKIQQERLTLDTPEDWAIILDEWRRRSADKW